MRYTIISMHSPSCKIHSMSQSFWTLLSFPTRREAEEFTDRTKFAPCIISHIIETEE